MENFNLPGLSLKFTLVLRRSELVLVPVDSAREEGMLTEKPVCRYASKGVDGHKAAVQNIDGTKL